MGKLISQVKSKSQAYISIVKLIQERFEFLETSQGWKQIKLSNISGVSPSTVNRIFTQDKLPDDAENLLSILHALNLLDRIIVRDMSESPKFAPQSTISPETTQTIKNAISLLNDLIK